MDAQVHRYIACGIQLIAASTSAGTGSALGPAQPDMKATSNKPFCCTPRGLQHEPQARTFAGDSRPDPRLGSLANAISKSSSPPSCTALLFPSPGSEAPLHGLAREFIGDVMLYAI